MTELRVCVCVCNWMLVEGRPTMQAAEQLRVKQEAQELNLNNIIASEGTEYRLLVMRFQRVADSAGIFSF